MTEQNNFGRMHNKQNKNNKEELLLREKVGRSGKNLL